MMLSPLPLKKVLIPPAWYSSVMAVQSKRCLTGTATAEEGDVNLGICFSAVDAGPVNAGVELVIRYTLSRSSGAVTMR